MDKLGLINQTKKDDLSMLNKDNMQLSYEIDELMDRINAKRAAKNAKKEKVSPGKNDNKTRNTLTLTHSQSTLKLEAQQMINMQKL